METSNTPSSVRLAIRSLMPSAASLTIGFLISVVLLALHILFFSLNKGSFTPGFSSNGWIQTYTDFIIHPLETFFHDSTLNTILTAVVWGLVGLVIYTVLEAIINATIAWSSDKRNVHIVDSKRIQLHPLRRTLLARALWRMLISIIVVLLVVLTGTLSHSLLVSLDNALNGRSVMAIAKHVGLVLLVWTALIYCYVVLLRLFMFRTRLMGELIK